MKVAMIGSRHAGFDTMPILFNEIPVECSEIISGSTKGIDILAKKVAVKLQVKYTCLRPVYREFGRTASNYCNNVIIDKADLVLVLWNGSSTSSK